MTTPLKAALDAGLKKPGCLRIGIVGGGASGFTLCLQLLRKATSPVQLVLFERREENGGLAYGTSDPRHLLNVPASRMSLLPEEPDHFLRWLASRNISSGPLSFLPREVFGRYLVSSLNAEITTACERWGENPVVLKREEVSRIEAGANGSMSIVPASGTVVEVDRVVLASGNVGAADNRFFSETPGVREVLEAHAFFPNPWDRLNLENLRDAEAVAVIGTGLTAADMFLSLVSSGFRGKIIAISRHGHLSQDHQAASFAPPHSFVESPEGWTDSAQGFFRGLRSEVDRAAKVGTGWRSVIDALRPYNAILWQRLNLRERRRFLRHVRHYWDIHRHRMAPEVHESLSALKASGRLEVVAGRLTRMAVTKEGVQLEVRKRNDQSLQAYRVNAVFNCVGPSWDLSSSKDPLTAHLLRTGKAKPHPCGFGFEVDADGKLVGEGMSQCPIHTIGPLRIGQLWESIAIPEVRAQAAKLADQLLNRG